MDNDAVVINHARALMERGHPSVDVVAADLRKPQEIVGLLRENSLIDFRLPVGLLLVAVLHFVRDSDDPYGVVRTLMSAFAPGSYLVISHATGDDARPDEVERVTETYDGSSAEGGITLRSRREIEQFFAGLELLEPGVVSISEWRHETLHEARPRVMGYGGVGAKRGPAYLP